MNKLLLVSSNTIHTYKYLELIKGYFDEVLVLTNEKSVDFDYSTVELPFNLTVKNLFTTVSKIREQITLFNPTVIHIHQANSFAFYTLLANKKVGIPSILTAWGSDILMLPRQNILLRAMVKFNLRNADWLTSDSAYMAHQMKKLSTLKHEVLIANFGIDVSKLACEKENIIYSNRLHKNLYNIHHIIQSFAEFVNRNSADSWKLVIAGSGSETDNLKDLTRTLGIAESVIFVGWVNKVENEKWYSVSRLWVSIPASDATSISLLEAMFCGCIPVVSDLPANREWIESGINGLVVTDFQSDFLSQALALNQQEVADRNNEIIVQHATKSANRDKFINLYKSALS